MLMKAMDLILRKVHILLKYIISKNLSGTHRYLKLEHGPDLEPLLVLRWNFRFFFFLVLGLELKAYI
jgi:hypothetical protein